MRKYSVDHVSKCYSVNAVSLDGKLYLAYAGEGEGSLTLYNRDDFSDRIQVFTPEDHLGGVMSVNDVSDRPGYLFISTGFFTMIDSGSSSIWLVRPGKDMAKVCDIPYLHRFDVITVDGHRYLIACSLHNGKKDKDDWSTAGSIYVAELPYDLDGDIAVQPEVLMSGLHQNHGFFRDGKSALVSCREGVFRVTCPSGSDGWKAEQLFSFPASDVCAIDIDGDGRKEYGIISPFHGNSFLVHREDGTRIYEHAKPLDFYHAITADTWNGVPVMVIGARKMDMDLYMLAWDREAGRLKPEVIETGSGSSNVRIIHNGQEDLLMTANRQVDEAAFFVS